MGIPPVHAVRPAARAEIVSTIASASAGPDTRQNIDEFTFTTGHGLVTVGPKRSSSSNSEALSQRTSRKSVAGRIL